MKLFSFLITVVFLLILTISCDKIDLIADAPKCIEREIKDILKEDVRNPPTIVVEWKVDGKTYYYITSGCCDQLNYLYDSNCNVVCAPDGGFTGNGDDNCPEFSEPIETTVIWEDNRK